MKTFIKNAGLFLAGGATFMYLYSTGLTNKTKYPREGTVLFEDEDMKIIRMSDEKAKNVDLATVVYKNQTTNEES